MKQNSLIQLARKSLAGLTELGPTLNVGHHCTSAQLSLGINTADNKCQAFDLARSGKTQAYLDLRQTRADANTFIGSARDHLKSQLGQTYNGLWNQIGFRNSNLLTPKVDADRLRLLTGFQTYFGDHETHELPAFSLTAARAEELNGQLTAGIQTVTNCRLDTRSKRDERDAAIAELQKKLDCLWTELEAAMTPTDPRWLKFVDRIPGDPRVPEKVENVTASAQTGGIIVLDWPDAARAARYKIYRQILGMDAEPVLAATVEDSDAQVTDVPEGVTVKLQIVPTNATGDGPPSDVIQLQAA